MKPDYKAFAHDIIAGSFDGSAFEGCEIQDIAVKHGILKQVAYDPKAHGRSDELEPGDPWFEFVEKP